MSAVATKSLEFGTGRDLDRLSCHGCHAFSWSLWGREVYEKHVSSPGRAGEFQTQVFSGNQHIFDWNSKYMFALWLNKPLHVPGGSYKLQVLQVCGARFLLPHFLTKRVLAQQCNQRKNRTPICVCSSRPEQMFPKLEDDFCWYHPSCTGDVVCVCVCIKYIDL